MTQRIVLTGPHTHQGAKLVAGTVIDVDDATAQWLIEHAGATKAGVTRKPKTETGPADSPTEEQE
ncbi:virion structural protein [Pseudomonas phage VW-6B]|nr:virion structural protein [Pseudomonas phage VW-6B]